MTIKANTAGVWRESETFFDGDAPIAAIARNLYALQCPNCQNITTKRRDSLLLGAHQVTCSRCNFSSDRVTTVDGTEHGKTDADIAGEPGTG